jgi:N-acylneuraminate cytidylyltransferase
MIYALIPVRGGSKSIPMKNIKIINGKPLVWWVLNSANNSVIDKVFVSTDSDKIRETVESFDFHKVEVIGRSEESCGDLAKTEVVMEEFVDNYEFDDLVLIQATSPLLTTKDINGMIDKFKKEEYDSIVPIVRQKRFIWDDFLYWSPVNYDYNDRPMRQEFDGFFVETGCMYITKRESFVESKNRLSGNMGAYEFPEYMYYEIDEEYDWIIVESLLKKYYV